MNDPHFVLHVAVGGSEVFPCISTAVCSSYKVLYHQAHVNDRKTVTDGKTSLNSHKERYSNHTGARPINRQADLIG